MPVYSVRGLAFRKAPVPYAPTEKGAAERVRCLFPVSAFLF